MNLDYTYYSYCLCVDRKYIDKGRTRCSKCNMLRIPTSEKQIKLFSEQDNNCKGVSAFNMKRTKKEVKPALKAQDYKEGDIVKPSVSIAEISDLETRFGDKTIIVLNDGDTIFLNTMSINNLIDAYGEEDNLWLNKFIKVVCEKDEVFKKLYLVVHPLDVAK